MQTILGSSGIIGREIAYALPQYTDKIRLVSRNPKRVNATDELFQADLTIAEQTMKAVENSEIVYLTVGLQYKISTWRQQWPVIMKNVIEACKAHKAKLVFFDNVYMYGKVSGWMTEETPLNPCSEKGKVRAGIARMLMDEVEKGNLTALIARSADFYGPNTPLSFVNVMVFDNHAKGKKAQWMINENLKHSLTFTPDAGKATALLGNTESAFNQTWHLPTDKNVLTGKEIIEKSAAAFGLEPKYTVLSRPMIKLAGIFIPVIRESVEMLYQSDSEYLFDSTKFDNAFRFNTTVYDDGVRKVAKSMKL